MATELEGGLVQQFCTFKYNCNTHEYKAIDIEGLEKNVASEVWQLVACYFAKSKTYSIWGRLLDKIWLTYLWWLQSYWADCWIWIYSAYIPCAGGWRCTKNHVSETMIDINLSICTIKELCKTNLWTKFGCIMIDGWNCRVIVLIAGFWYIVHIYLVQVAGSIKKIISPEVW